jgi:putative PIN family toxin of toxin-antitoxin system
MIIVFDSGVWISAIRFDGIPEEAIIHAATENRIVICAEIEREVIRNMHLKFKVAEDEVRRRMVSSLQNSVRISLTAPFPAICRDPKDDFILECAMLGHANIIVTGDKDLLSLATHGATRVLTPRQYLDIAQPQRAR